MLDLDIIEEKLFKYMNYSKLSSNDSKKFKNLLFHQKPLNIAYFKSKYNIHPKFEYYLKLWNNSTISPTTPFAIQNIPIPLIYNKHKSAEQIAKERLDFILNKI